MKITQSWKRNIPTTDGYSVTVTYVYSAVLILLNRKIGD